MNTQPAEKHISAADHTLLSDEPTWYKDAIVYQLHVKSFFDSNNDGIGDFPGLIEKLEYVAGLGVNTVWLLPFYPSPLRDDGYDIADYYGVHPDYGSIEDVKNFIDKAHSLGLRVITELVINHTSDQHPWFQKARSAPPGSPERDYYVWSDDDQKYSGTRIIFLDTEKSNWSWDAEAKAYYWHRFYSHQPDLNFDNPAVLDAVLDVMCYWLDMGVDGLRLDAVPYLVEREGTNNENLPETHAILKRIRAEVDAKYPGRLLLAEANQWPEDTQEYFGDGDECHMAFHFPLMPRMYMALAQEDRFPITDILRQTPVIPENCQWAIFLRNHDELTLEMVTDKERDYLWEQYAAESRARLNLGIRRRLAPLMQRDRRRIELLTSLLFSMPGTPIIYYGDEIGMGDNIYLGDRDGVRTPMQWSPDRNGGFSKADPSRLMLPPIMDPLYGYYSVNVEAQSRDPHSSLNWARLLLEVRKQYRAFGRGLFRMLYPNNRRVLAYIREYQPVEGSDHRKESVLCVANMSRTAQAVELDLSAYAGCVPLEMTGGSSFPPIGELTYLLTLPPYGFFWFLLAGETQYPDWYTPPPATMPEYVTIVLRDGLRDVTDPSIKPVLERDVLPEYLGKRRWFAGKGAHLGPVRITHLALFPAPEGDAVHQESSHIGLMQIAVDVSGETQQYQIPITLFYEDSAPSALAHQLALTRIRRKRRIGVLTDGICSDYLARRFVELLQQAQSDQCLTLESIGGEDVVMDGEAEPSSAGPVFCATPALAEMQLDTGELEIRTLSVEQSNSSVIIGERAVLKVLRRVFSGRHPEIDMSGALTRGGFANTAPLLGYVYRNHPTGEPTALAILQGYIPNQGNGWEWILDQLDRVRKETTALMSSDVGDDDVIDVIRRQEEFTCDECDRFAYAIGRRLAEMHIILARDSDDSAFQPAIVDDTELERWIASVQGQVEQAMQHLQQYADNTDSAEEQAIAWAIVECHTAIRDKVEQLAQQGQGSLIFRIHGDLHLGQILVAQDDAYFIDFEGEPAKSVTERSGKASPLRDVAGMLRSFHYAVETSAGHARVVEFEQADAAHARFLDEFHQRSTETMLRAYREHSCEIPHQWQSDQAEGALIDLFTLEKAAYEVVYEATNRPDWVPIPLRGLASVLQRIGIGV